MFTDIDAARADLEKNGYSTASYVWSSRQAGARSLAAPLMRLHELRMAGFRVQSREFDTRRFHGPTREA